MALLIAAPLGLVESVFSWGLPLHYSVHRPLNNVYLSIKSDAKPPLRPVITMEDNGEAEFRQWLDCKLANAPNADMYAALYSDAADAIVQWRRRYRGSPRLWRSVFKAERVLKELVETAPVIASVRSVVASMPKDERCTIVDLASGKGYLSMFLSEMLPSERIERCFLVDKAWPAHDWEGPIASHHISDEHIYESREGTGESYFTTWPIALHTSKQNLKNRATLRSMQRHVFSRSSGPILILAIHLCGTLALRAVDLFNENPKQVKLLALKPCAPPPSAARRTLAC